MLVFDINYGSQPVLLPSANISWPCKDRDVEMDLQGIVYVADFHFSARLVGGDHRVWNYDGHVADGVPCLDEAASAAYAAGGPTFWKHMTSLDGSKAHLLVYSPRHNDHMS